MDKELKTSFNGIRTCTFAKDFSLGFSVSNAQVGVTSAPYLDKGSYSSITIFDLQPEDMYYLAGRIIEEANKIGNHEVKL